MTTARLSSEEIDARILDVTAGLLARKGLKDTAVQAVADATGYSKTGILHRFATKKVLVDRSIRQCHDVTATCLATVASLPFGRERDARALEALTRLALQRRGWAEMVLAAVPSFRHDEIFDRVRTLGEVVSAMFDPMPTSRGPSLERRARVIGALSALIVLALSRDDGVSHDRAQSVILATCWNSLGHEGPPPNVV